MCRYKKDGIAVQSVTPGFVVSNMSKFRKPNLLGGVCNPDVITKGSLNAIGQDVHCNPFFMHALIEYVLSLFLSLSLCVCVCVCDGGADAGADDDERDDQ
jgi:short-subunit dehydrogenase